jgi:hypothetical protein
METQEAVDRLIERQTANWETARSNYAALSNVRVKWIEVDGERYKVQFNPARIISSGAKVDAATIKSRPCFLCQANRPPEQEALPFAGRYDILVNPFPIFPRHLTIVARTHTAQSIATRFADMLQAAKELPGYTVFYNGPRCGASAPDHMHFQAGNRGFMPIEESWSRMKQEEIISYGGTRLSLLADKRSPLMMESADSESACRVFGAICRALPTAEGDYEPMLNLLCTSCGTSWRTFIFPRAKHRPSCYTAEGDKQLLCSPASVDMGGAFIIPREQDFARIDSTLIEQMIAEVCMPADKTKDALVNISSIINTFC